MSPGAKWRRLRNTLKAAHEMQAHKKKQALSRDDSFLRKFSTRNQRLHHLGSPGNDDGGYAAGFTGGTSLPRNPNEPRAFKPPRNFAVQHDGNFMFNWLGVVTVAVLYNLWTCILRQAFHEVQDACHACWFTCDVLVDLIYLLDVLVQFRTGYLNQGLMVYDSKKMSRHYIQSRLLSVDLLCLLPLDFLQFYTGPHPMLRFPRFLKVYRTFRFIHMLESRTAYPNLIRVANLTHILFLGAHWFAAFYYMISEAVEFRGQWSYPSPVGEFASVSRKYLASLFWSTLTLTTIGALPPQENGKDYGMSDAAYVFVIVSYLIGVFVFATIVGQVGNVINNKNASRQEFERLLDGAKVYMQTHNVPSDLQKRVQRWYDYVWSRGRLNGCDINSLGLLPDKLKTELAIHVNLETLKKVTIFQECQPEFLHDLVLKMKAYIFTPGDLICRRGEVAREMFIIADGVVEIISENGTVLKQMGAGDFFGEIGILNLDGGINRRSADVKSVGYSELFVLSRDDVLAALKDHPDAESIIRDYGQRRLREIEAHRQLVKPLKQLGTAGHRLLNLRNSGSSAHNSTTASANTATESGTTANPSGIYAHARPGARGNCYMHRLLNDDIDPAYSGTADSNNVFQSVWSNFRRIFHRKVRRWKGSEGEEEGGSMGSGSRRRKGEGKQDWQLGDSGGKNRGRGGGGGGGGRMVRLCCRSEDSKGDDNRGKQKGYLPVPVSSSAVGSRDPVPKRVTRAFYNSPSGYTAVLTEEEETSRCSTPSSPTRPLMNAVLSNSKVIIKHDLIVSDASIKSASTGHTVVEVNSEDSNSAGEGPPASPSHPIFSLRPLDRPELRLINNSGEICDPCRPASAAGANVFFDRGEPSGGKNFHADDNGGEQDANLRANRLFVTSSIDRRCSEPVPQKRTQSESFLGSPSSFIRSSHTLPDCSPSGLDIFHGNSSMPHPCIRVESASTVDSDGSTDKVSLVDSSSSNFLHPCYQPPGQDRANEAEEEEEEEDDDEEDIVCRYRSNSAPSIVVAHAPPGSSVQLPLPYSGAALSTAGSSVAVGAVAASPTAQRVGLFQRRMGSWTQLDGCKRHAKDDSSGSNETITDSTARRASWIPAKDPLMHVHGASRDPDHVVSEQNEYLTSLLVQLQFSHELLHSRMSELETVYLSNRERLDRLGSVQADIMTLLHAQLQPQQQQQQQAGKTEPPPPSSSSAATSRHLTSSSSSSSFSARDTADAGSNENVTAL